MTPETEMTMIELALALVFALIVALYRRMEKENRKSRGSEASDQEATNE